MRLRSVESRLGMSPVIDLGSNSWRLVVYSYEADPSAHWWKPRDELYEAVRIGEGMGATGALTERAMSGWPVLCDGAYLCVVLSVAGALATAVGGATASPNATKVVYVAPVNARGHQLPNITVLVATKGSCGPGSDSVPGPVYRCFNDDNNVLDPCWAAADSSKSQSRTPCSACRTPGRRTRSDWTPMVCRPQHNAFPRV